MKANVAALFVDPRGPYPELVVDYWDEGRDAMKYAGPLPVVVHPPCARWCMPLAKVNETRYGHKVGDDGGMFAFALEAVRRWGGILEHPANSAAFGAFGLPKPSRGWTRCIDGGWTCMVNQRAYGHRASKRTWLYCFGCTPPNLDWSEPEPEAIVGWLQRTTSTLPRMSKREASETPIEFAKLLVSIAESAPLGREVAAIIKEDPDKPA